MGPEPSNIIEVAFVDILNEGKPRNIYRVTFTDPIVDSSEEFLFFMNDEDDPLPASLGWGRDETGELPNHIVEIEKLLYRNAIPGMGHYQFPAFTNATGMYFRENFWRGQKGHRSDPDRKIDLFITEEGRVLPVLETGSTVMIGELRHDCTPTIFP